MYGIAVAALAALAIAAIAWGLARKALGDKPPRAESSGGDLRAPPHKAKDHQPSVVLISLDTLRPDHLGSFGYAKPTSPNLDRFAASATRFTRTHAQAPWTLPSHMSLFTSMLPSHNGVDNLYNVLPTSIPTLPELLRADGYHTAGLVNDGQMQAHWGFARGFDTWREFPVDRPAGDCRHLTEEALRWLERRPREPFFLFLHYYDVHDPYDAPPAFKDRFGTRLSREEADKLLWDYHWPGRDMTPEDRAQLVAAYDAEIAWLDHEIQRLLEAIPSEALVVIFSDHGEAFEEHGWTWHGATLHEEETRTVLLIRPPASASAAAREGRAVDTPAMLMDVAPTILDFCGLTPPPTFGGRSLVPLLRGVADPAWAERPIPSETKAFREGNLFKSLERHPWKLVYDLHRGTHHLYRLPDEETDLATHEPEAAASLLGSIREWVREETFWVLYAQGRNQVEVAVEVPAGQFAVAIPLDFDQAHDRFDLSPDARSIRWTSQPREGTRALFLQLAPSDLPIAVDLAIDGVRSPQRLFAGKGDQSPPRLPAELRLPDTEAQDSLDPPLTPTQPGLYVRKYIGTRGGDREGRPLDEGTLKRLRSLHYLD